MVELRTQEQQLLSALQSKSGGSTVEELIEVTKLQDTAIMRTALTLQEKNLVTIHANYQNNVKLTVEGEQYAENGLPERKLVQAVMALNGKTDLKRAAEQAGIKEQIVQIGNL